MVHGFADQHDIQKRIHAWRAPLGVRTDGQRNTCREHGAVWLVWQRRVRWIYNDYHAQIPNLRQEIGRDSVAVFDAYTPGAPDPRAASLLHQTQERFRGPVADGMN